MTQEFLTIIKRKLPGEIGKQDLKDYIAALRLRISHPTVCNYYVSIVCFLHFCGVDHKKLLPQSERPTPNRSGQFEASARCRCHHSLLI